MIAVYLAVVILGSVALGWLLHDEWQERQARKAERIVARIPTQRGPR